MNILISAGGTRERIDSVRSIANAATGRLGSLVAACFDEVPETERIFYVCAPNVPRPDSARAVVTVVEDTAGLEKAVREILGHNRVDAIIHSMAVSDYRARSVTTAARIAERARSVPVIEAIDSAPSLGRDAKISSDEDRLIIVLEPAPKIISLFQTLAPRALLVGFKLLDHASHEALIDAARRILEKNRCAFVLANDARDIHDDVHIAYLIDKAGRIRRFGNKHEIARGITEALVAQLKEKNAG
ncbi:MAG: phosphopantothenoylcysteine synthase [Treponema sp.]|nr:phosphopantothenoylcysteine synthase [Treponema sp.]